VLDDKQFVVFEDHVDYEIADKNLIRAKQEGKGLSSALEDIEEISNKYKSGMTIGSMLKQINIIPALLVN
jgi:hypothetical protein